VEEYQLNSSDCLVFDWKSLGNLFGPSAPRDFWDNQIIWGTLFKLIWLEI